MLRNQIITSVHLSHLQEKVNIQLVCDVDIKSIENNLSQIEIIKKIKGLKL